MIYLDNATAAAPSERALSAMMPYLTTKWGLSSAPHQKGQELFSAMSAFYKMLYTAIGANEEATLVVTSSGAEAVNHAIASCYRDVTLTTGKNHFLVANGSEAAAVLSMAALEPMGCVAKSIDGEEGRITEKTLREALSPRTALVSLSWGCGLTGQIQPVREIAKLCKERGVRLHLDATHVFGKLSLNINEIDPDYLTLSGEPLHAPRGTGLLYVKPSLRPSPFIFGSKDQAGMRAGGVNMAALAALATALREALETQDLLCTEVARLRNRLEQGICKKVQGSAICFKKHERLPHCTALLFPGLVSEALLFAINRKGVCASMGGGNFLQLGLLLKESGRTQVEAQSALSFSLSRTTKEEEIERAIAIISEAALFLQNLSPVIGGVP